jgi:hypothetical protein
MDNEALRSQIDMVKIHIERIKNRRDRYEYGTWHYAVSELEVSHLKALLAILEANLNGKTVQMS